MSYIDDRIDAAAEREFMAALRARERKRRERPQQLQQLRERLRKQIDELATRPFSWQVNQ